MQPTPSWQPRLLRAGLSAVVAILIVFLYLTFLAGRFKGITSVVAMDYAQVARNLAQGEGYTTKVVRPLSLATVPNARLQRHPEFGSAPLHPYVASLFMRLMADKDRAVALSSGLAYLLTAPVVLFLGWQLFDLRTGMLATALYVTNLIYLRFSISGLELTWLGLWASLLFLVCHTLSRKQRLRPILAGVAGVLVGLCYLTEYAWLCTAVPVAAYVWYSTERTGRRRILGVFGIAAVLVMLPWWVRTYNVGGWPFLNFREAEAIMATRSHPGNTLYRSYTQEVPSLLTYAIGRPMEILQKLQDGLGTLYGALTRVAGPYVTPFFLVAIFVTLGSATFERVRLLWYGMFVMLCAVLLFTSPADRLLVPLGPTATVIAAGFFLRLLGTKVADATPRLRMQYLTLAIGVLTVIHALPLGFSLFGGMSDEERLVARLAAGAREVASLTEGPIITDVPWLIAWYGDRTAVWLPKTRVDLHNMQDKFGKVPWLLLTEQIIDERYDAAERTIGEWGPVYREGLAGDVDFEGYRLYKRVADGRWELFRADPRAKRDLPPEVMEHYKQQGQP